VEGSILVADKKCLISGVVNFSGSPVIIEDCQGLGEGGIGKEATRQKGCWYRYLTSIDKLKSP